jgi:hypothetical protein
MQLRVRRLKSVKKANDLHEAVSFAASINQASLSVSLQLTRIRRGAAAIVWGCLPVTESKSTMATSMARESLHTTDKLKLLVMVFIRDTRIPKTIISDRYKLLSPFTSYLGLNQM